MGDVWVSVVWVCILIFVWLRGKIRVGEWCCEVVGSCEVQLSCEVWCSIYSHPDIFVHICAFHALLLLFYASSGLQPNKLGDVLRGA